MEDKWLLERIGEVHAANCYAYGYRSRWKALLRADEQVLRCRVRDGPRPARPPAGRSGRAQLHRPDAGPAVGMRLHASTLLDGIVDFALVMDVYSRRTVGWHDRVSTRLHEL